MPIVSFSDEDIKSGYLVKNPGRFNYEISDIKQKPAKTDGSPVYQFIFKGMDGEMAGVLVVVGISSKAKWLLVPLFRAANGGKELEKDYQYNTDDLKGVVISAMTSRGQTDQGTYFNALGDYLPAQ